MRHPKIALLAGLLLPLLAALVFRAAVAKAAAAGSCAWQAIPAPNPSGDDQVNAIAATSETSAWIVGSYYTSSNDVQTLIEHWNGSQWSIVKSPTLSSSSLHGVAASSANDVWAVGYASGNTLIEHWNGTTWSVVKSPSSGELDVRSVFSATDAWTVGWYGSFQTLTEHWNGTSWSVVPSPNPAAYYDRLSGVAVVPGSTQVWAEGIQAAPTGNYQILTELYC